MGLLDEGVGTVYNTVTGGASKKGQEASARGVEAFEGLELPEIEKMKVELDRLVSTGELKPEEAQTLLQNQSELKGISLDPRLKQAQMQALSSLQDIGQNNGLTDMDRAQLADIQNQENVQSKGARDAILQNAQMRGMGGSGLEMLSQLQNEQDSATRRSMRDTSVAGMAQQRALQAIQQAGQLGGQIGEQQFGQQAQVAGAQDAINRFNTANLNTNNLANVGARNAAQEFNLKEKQRIADTNTAMGNQNKVNNANLLQQNYDNQLKKASGISGASTAQAQQYNQQAEGIQKLIGTGAAAAGAASDVNVKEDIEPFDPSEFLDSITGYKYRYKDPEKFGAGNQVGVMAQDLEKGAPQMVTDTPEGKMVDYNKAGGPLFASLANIHDRVKKMEDEKKVGSEKKPEDWVSGDTHDKEKAAEIANAFKRVR